MTLGLILALYAACIVCRAIIFSKRDVRPIWAFVPGVNKYKLGKLSGCKKLAKLNAILHPLCIASFLFCFGYELWIIKEYAYAVQVPVNGIDYSKVEVLVPDDVALVAVWSKYFLIAVAAATITVWSMMMWKFTIQHDRNPWWIMLWAIIPIIPYVAFALSSTVVIDGKKYVTKRVEVEEVSTKKKFRDNTSKKKLKKNKSIRKRNHTNEKEPA